MCARSNRSQQSEAKEQIQKDPILSKPKSSFIQLPTPKVVPLNENNYDLLIQTKPCRQTEMEDWRQMPILSLLSTLPPPPLHQVDRLRSVQTNLYHLHGQRVEFVMLCPCSPFVLPNVITYSVVRVCCHSWTNDPTVLCASRQKRNDEEFADCCIGSTCLDC